MTLARKIDGGWEVLKGMVTLTEMATTARLHFRGTRPDETVEVEPYPVETAPMNAAKIEALFRAGTWGEAEKALYGIDVAEPFEAPKGKHTVGEMRIVERDGRPVEDFDVEDTPPPPPPPTTEEKLAAVGLSDDEFDALVARSLERQKANKEADAPVR